MTVARIDQLYVQTQHWERSLAFWKALGFVVVRQWGEAGQRGCQLKSEAAGIILAELEDRSHLPDRPTPWLAARDFDSFGAKVLESPDVEVVLPPQRTHWGTRWMRVQDPDGNIYAIESPQPV